MERRILLQITAPAAVLGLVLFGACLVAAWIVNRLQTDMSNILSQNVSSLEAAQELEIDVRKLRFLCYRYLVNTAGPSVDQVLLQEIQQVTEDFRGALQEARASANTPEEKQYVREIANGFDRYEDEFRRLRDEVVPLHRNYNALADETPILSVVDPCERFLKVNKEIMSRTRLEADRVSHRLSLVLLLLGVVGPASGLIVGWSVSRGLSRSIHLLRVRVQDMAQHLDEDVGSVSMVPQGDVRGLDAQLDYVVRRVQERTSELHRHQREMIRAQQLSAVGQLAASVAHEVRNPLMSIKMLAEAALRNQNPRPFTRDNLRVICNEIVRLERTVQAFLDFTRPPALQRDPCDLREVVAESVELVRARADQQGVALAVEAPDRDATAEVDRGQLCTVLVNLLLNALDAMPNGGRLRLRLQAPPASEPIVLNVEDTGPGIAEAMEGQLFTPFASTKSTGTGLGLCICRRIVAEHGGRIEARNLAEGGACFTLSLPTGARKDGHADVTGN